MSYQVLYRAWRPATFSEMSGQDAVVQTLKNQVSSGRIAHAYLFCGTRGTGKTTAAKVLARAINCENPQNGDPCGKCESCLAMAQESTMDIVEIDAASNNGVDEMRELRDKVKFPPSQLKYRVYIIDEVHMLSTGAFNAMLKTLEEPPQHAVFILATTEPYRLPATVLSRCQRYDFHRISVNTLAKRIREVIHGEGRQAEDGAVFEVARQAEGAFRDALSILDMCLSSTDGVLTQADVLSCVGVAGRGAIFDLTDKIFAYDTAGALELVEKAVLGGQDAQMFCRQIAQHLRGVLMAKSMGEKAEDTLEVSKEDMARFIRQAQAVEQSQLFRLMELFMGADGDMRFAYSPRDILELAVCRACAPEEEENATAMERVARLENLLKEGKISIAAPEKEKKEEKPKAAAPKAAPAKPAAAQIKTQANAPSDAFMAAKAEIMEKNPSIRRFADAMIFAGDDQDCVVIEFAKRDMMAQRMLEAKKDIVSAALEKAYGRPMRLMIRAQQSAAAPGISRDARDVIQKAYDVFSRENIEITD